LFNIVLHKKVVFWVEFCSPICLKKIVGHASLFVVDILTSFGDKNVYALLREIDQALSTYEPILMKFSEVILLSSG